MVPVIWSPFAATIVPVPLPKTPSGVIATAPWRLTVYFPRWVATPVPSAVKAPVSTLRLTVPEIVPFTGRSVPPAFAGAEAGLIATTARARPASVINLRMNMVPPSVDRDDLGRREVGEHLPDGVWAAPPPG